MTTIQIRIDEKTKRSAKKVLAELGLDLSTAIKAYLKQITLRKGLPFRVLTENGYTLEEEQEILKAAEEARQGKNISGPFTPEEAIAHLRSLRSR